MPAPIADAAMSSKEVWQLVVSALAPFIAAGAAVGLYALQQKERISCFITFGYGQGWKEISLLGIHNRSGQPVAITRIRYRSGLIFRKPSQGTALDYEDPIDLSFPYIVPAGEIIKLQLEEHQAKRLADSVSSRWYWLAWVFRRSRVIVECTTTTGSRYRTSAEPVLPWDDQLPWTRA